MDGHGGTAINHVIFTPPSDATTAWDLAVALDKYKGDHPSTISPELAAKCGCQIDQPDAVGARPRHTGLQPTAT